MHTVVAHVWLRLETKILPFCQYLATQRVCWCFRWVGWSKQIPTEICPRQRCRIPLDRIVKDLRTWFRELRPHGHEEAVEDVECLATSLDETAVETAAKLHKLLVSLSLCPLFIQAISIDPQLRTTVHSIEDLARCQSILPLQAKLCLELVLWYI